VIKLKEEGEDVKEAPLFRPLSDVYTAKPKPQPRKQQPSNRGAGERRLGYWNDADADGQEARDQDAAENVQK